MNIPHISTYDIRSSKNNQKIPVINGVHLHSIYDPLKEAESFISKHDKLLEKKNKVLFLGLGFAYHINSASSKLKNNHENNFQIVIIEPNEQTVSYVNSLNLLNLENVLIYSNRTSPELFRDFSLVDFLSQGPGVIAHPSSFNLYNDYFKEFLSYRAPISLQDIRKIVKSKTVGDYLSKQTTDQSLTEYIEQDLKSKNKISDNIDYLLLALHHIVAPKGQGNITGELLR